MHSYKETVKKYYDDDPQKEWNRLATDFPYEKYITTHMMDRYIRPGMNILDIGGGPGHYSIYYASRGHNVTLLDLSDGNIAFAKEKARENKVTIRAEQGDAMDLSRFPDEHFDIVFIMGPLYHIANKESRMQVFHEACRVLKKDGYLFGSYILGFGHVVYSLRDLEGAIMNTEDRKWLDAIADGQETVFSPFTYAFLTTIADAKAEVQSLKGMRLETLFGQESILAPYRNKLASLPREEQLAWYDYAMHYCDQPEYLTHTEHLMVILQKQS